MKLYDESIARLYEMLDGFEKKQLDFSNRKSDWIDSGTANMLLRGDMAYELGGDELPAISGLALTTDEYLIPKDEILLYGPDLPEIKADIPYARLAFVRVKKDSMGEGNTLYNAIRKIEYVRYHLNPKGFMMRISASNDSERARVGKAA